jgi:Domain of unknown function (DUF4249)
MKQIAFLFISLMWGCIDSTEIKIPTPTPILTIDALISDQPSQSLIRLGWSFQLGEPCVEYGSFIGPCSIDDSTGSFKVEGTLTITDLDSPNNYSTSFHMKDKTGLIEIYPDFTGEVLHRYRLEINILYEGQTNTYSSETRMNQTPVISDIGYVIRKGDVGKNDNYVPLISFTDLVPEKENYYLFKMCIGSGVDTSCGNDRVWPYSIISDKFLATTITALSIDDGASIAKYAEWYPPFSPGDALQVKMYSITKETFEFYKALLAQFDNDGGGYRPTPSTPPGNIAGDAIGLFRATSESFAIIYP